MSDNTIPNARLVKFLELEKSRPNEVFVLYAIALEYKRVNDLKKCIQYLHKVLELDAQDIGALFQLAQVCEQQEAYEKALQFYEKGIQAAEQKKDLKALGELKEALVLLKMNLED